MRKGHPGHDKLLLPGLHGADKSSGFSGGFVAGGGAAGVVAVGGGGGGGYLQILSSPGPVHHPQHGGLCAPEQQAAASFIYSTPHGPAARAGLLQPTLGRPPAKRRLELGDGSQQYLSEGLKTPKGKGRATVLCPDSPKSGGCTLPDDGCNMARCQGLSKELSELSQEEKKLDELIQNCTLDLKLLTEDSENQRLAYVTYQDIRKISGLKDQTVVVVRAPPETRLEVPDPVESLQIHLSSTQGPIEVYLCPEESESSSPIKQSSPDQNGNLPKPNSKDFLSPNLENVNCKVEPISPLTSPTNLLQQTEDQIPLSLDSSFVNLLPPLIHEDYLLSLGEEEGISDLFDAYELEKLPSLEDFMCS
ncbi:hypothetical protein GDO78_012717 [Eleutherodactylus coqui]|uniref:E2F transcription factor CC-MB domain-containing protein n=1 Tax=Eleutherodactylus coqui TaxID=57060 RepID=A0A8J6F235_ELECQ|nr:hypothetical protein GDO78_012717 [Eleutherodactylus coqui]